jgi:hypothetical protein
VGASFLIAKEERDKWGMRINTQRMRGTYRKDTEIKLKTSIGYIEGNLNNSNN